LIARKDGIRSFPKSHRKGVDVLPAVELQDRKGFAMKDRQDPPNLCTPAVELLKIVV
jgi:hypothetical protein